MGNYIFVLLYADFFPPHVYYFQIIIAEQSEDL